MLILLTAAAGTGIVSARGFLHTYGFLFNGRRRINIFILANVFMPAAGRRGILFLVLAHLAHLRFLFPSLPDLPGIGMLHAYLCMAQEAYNIFISMVIHLLKGGKSFYLINYQRILLFIPCCLHAM